MNGKGIEMSYGHRYKVRLLQSSRRFFFIFFVLVIIGFGGIQAWLLILFPQRFDSSAPGEEGGSQHPFFIIVLIHNVLINS